MSRFLVVCVGRNCGRFALRALESIAVQSWRDMRVAVVDDASTDGTSSVVRSFCENRDGWLWQVNSQPVGAMKNQVDAWRALEPSDDDVIVWCDLDDQLAHPRVLERLATVYRDRRVLLTYGSYGPVHSHEGACDQRCSCWTCPPARPYPRGVVTRGSLRAFIRAGGGFRFNHLRTVSWRVLRHLSDEDFKDDRGVWWQSGPDAAVMIPALELAGPRHRVLSDVLYLYTADNPESEWRRHPHLVYENHLQMLAREPKLMLR